MDPVLTALAFHQINEVHWYSSEGPDGFGSYNFATETVRGRLAERLAPLKRYKINDGPVVPMLDPSVGVNWLPNLAREAIFDIQRDYRWYCGVVDDDRGYQVLPG